MPDKVITMGRKVEVARLRGTATAPIGGDYREIKFMCRFTADAVNGGDPPAPEPQIRVRVTTRTPAYLYEVEIIPPGGTPEGLRMRRRDARPVPWARRARVEDGRLLVEPAPTTTQRTIGQTDWELDDPFGDFGGIFEDPSDPGGGLGGGGGGGGGGRTFTRILDPATDERGMWTVRLRNRSQDDEQFTITVDHPETVQNLVETRIPFQLINRTFAQAVLITQLKIKIDNGQARIEFDRVFRELTGIEDQIISVTDRIQDINLVDFKVSIANEDGTPTVTAYLDIEDRGEELDLPFSDIDAEDIGITCRVQIAFGYPKGPDFFETAMRRQDGQVLRKQLSLFTFLDMNPEISGLWADFADFFLFFVGSSIDELVQSAIDDAEMTLANTVRKAETYVQDVIMHLVDRDNVLFSVSSDEESMIVLHHRRPSLRDFIDLGGGATLPGGGVVVDPAASTASSATGLSRTNLSPRTVAELSAVPASTRSAALPLLREGEIDHIVILMMENRSFDHMLGYRHFAHPDVNGLTGNESNPFSQGPPYEVYRLTETGGIRSPAHSYGPTLEQIAGGSMSGFVENYSKRSGDPGTVMGYYDAPEVPISEFLANNFAICDAWFSSHPGPTQCNRFITLTGVTPVLDNLDLSDPLLAYYTGATVLDYLTQRGIDWVYAEGNVAFLRMFDRYRIDVSNIIPYRDDFNQDIENTFIQRVLDGNLPSVSFIDPRFIDVPPLWDGNDDHPPAELCFGQQLISEIYTLLSTASTWSKTMLIIVYDEHGGFYDHEPPPGLPGSLDPTPVPRVHPEGPTHLGVRVPAFVVSPWVDGGTVFHMVYDHTSILKTILQRFAPDDFPVADVFGPRAAGANGLLSEQLRTSPRREPAPQAPDVDCEDPIGPRGPSADIENDDFGLSMRLLGLPAKYRTRVLW
jgi:phospholipase C